LNHPSALSLDHSESLNSDEYTQLQNCIAIVGRLCDQLRSFDIPETIDHGDLHDGNVFVLDGNYRFFDWGDSGISHPFFSLHRTFRNVQERFDLQADSVWFTRLKVAYLQARSGYMPQDQLESAFDLAHQLAPIPAALRWLPVLNSMDAQARDKYAWAIPELMRELMTGIL
jgi:aminoglycoside phosphotransferase (APT) family kinase protein